MNKLLYKEVYFKLIRISPKVKKLNDSELKLIFLTL
jgi:hypothetical protein